MNLGLNKHGLCIDAGAASSSRYIHFPNHFLPLFVLKNRTNPAINVYQVVSSQILPAEQKSKHAKISFRVSIRVDLDVVLYSHFTRLESIT